MQTTDVINHGLLELAGLSAAAYELDGDFVLSFRD